MTSTINETEVYRMLDQIAELKAKLAQQERLLDSVAKSYDEKLTQAYISGDIKESTRRIIKEWQLFAGEKATENGLIAEQLEFTVRIAQDWQARAEAAERRVAELEAQLAAPWRPVTEPPTTGQRVRIVLNAFFVENSIGGYYWVETPRPDDGFSISTHADMIRYWQPLPAPPIDPSAPA